MLELPAATNISSAMYLPCLLYDCFGIYRRLQLSRLFTMLYVDWASLVDVAGLISMFASYPTSVITNTMSLFIQKVPRMVECIITGYLYFAVVCVGVRDVALVALC